MEDTRLPDSATRKRCPAEGCRDYEWHMSGTPDDEFHCFMHSPHCLQVGHTHPDPALCTREHCHAKKPGDAQEDVRQRMAAIAAGKDPDAG